MNMYRTAGTVVRAAFCQQSASHGCAWVDIRPKNSDSVVKVPYSLSNRSISGVSATILRTVCMTFRCIKGNVEIRYAADNHISPDHSLQRDTCPYLW